MGHTGTGPIGSSNSPLPYLPGFATSQFEDTRSDLVKQISKLERDAEKLGEIRATLVINFSEERKTDGIVIKKKPNELSMLIEVIEGYRKTLLVYQSAIREIEDERERLQQMYEERPPGMVEHRAAESILDALDMLKRSLA